MKTSTEIKKGTTKQPLAKKAKATRDTKSRQRFLDAAEYLFAEYGYEGAKIRAIAERSKVNLGALHHYWGSKEELFTAVCLRRLMPMNEESLRRFDQLVENSAGKTLNIRELFRASIEPTFFLSDLNKKEQLLFRKFYGRVLSEPSPIVGKILRDIFTPISIRFFALLRELTQHLSDDEFYWRANCIFGAYLYVPAFSDRISYYAHAEFDVNNVEKGIAQIVEFLVAGIMAPSLEKK